MARIVIPAKSLKKAKIVARKENKGNGGYIDPNKNRIKISSGHLAGKMRYRKGVKKYAFSMKKITTPIHNCPCKRSGE